MIDPLALGRSVVVPSGAAPPVAWSDCERIRVDAIEPDVADELGRAWRERRPVVVELTPDVGLDDPDMPPAETVVGRQPWEWPIDLDLVGERLHHAIWANSVDARRGVDHQRWRWADVACGLGADAVDAEADVTLPDGTPAVCDGGPVDAGLADRIGTAVVHRISLEHGLVRPLGPKEPVGLPLADDQLAAVAEPGAGARVIAPAGSGKTRVLTERARLLLGGWGLPPSAVALVAFNVRAAREMETRLADVAGVRVRTLNALGLRLCGGRSTIEEVDVRQLLSSLVTFPRRAETDPAAPWIEALGRVRLGLTDPAMVEDELPDVSDLDRVARAYRAGLAERGFVDFDEQVTGAIERLLADPHFRWRSQRFARVLLVDEFQDLTPAHLLLIRLLTGPAGAVFGVGDDDQTIYGYAGATPRWLVDFGSWFPGAAMHSLEVNYRCPPDVVAAASNLLTRNALRVPKVIRAAPTTAAADPAAPVEPLSVVAGGDRPARRTASRVRELVEAGASPSDIAVLTRVNASLVPVLVVLRHAGVPVESVIDRRYLQRGGVRAALAWMAVATAPARAMPGAVLREAARRPKRGMSASLLDLLAKRRSVEALTGLADWLEGKGSIREADKVAELQADVELVRDAAEHGSTADVLAVVREQVGRGGLEASALALDQWSHGAIAAHGDDLDALAELADLEPDPSMFPAWLSGQLDGATDTGGVTLASIHAVKGREWPHILLHHITDGLLPHRLAGDTEEERRVFHVGLTRCRSTVSIIPGSLPSPFLLELESPGAPVVAAVRTPPARAEAAPPARPGTAPAEVLAAVIGSSFTHRGNDHEIIEVTDRGVMALVGGGPARTAIAFGTSVGVEGRAALLAQPRYAEAWERLRAWRSERARAAGKPAFVVFDDKTLRLVAASLPTDEAGLLAISGIGPVKLETYGDELIAIAEGLRAGAAG